MKKIVSGVIFFPVRLLITFLILAIILILIILAGLAFAGLAVILVGIGAFIYGLFLAIYAGIKAIVSRFRRKKKDEEKS